MLFHGMDRSRYAGPEEYWRRKNMEGNVKSFLREDQEQGKEQGSGQGHRYSEDSESGQQQEQDKEAGHAAAVCVTTRLLG